MRWPWQIQQAPALAFAVLALVGGVGLHATADHNNAKLHKAQLAICERQNQVRKESNKRIKSHVADRDVLREFMAAARQARLASWERDRNPSDQAAAQEYAHLIDVLDHQVTFRSVPLVNCQKVVRE